ncbi:MAG TPA: S41 family peptidase, partial [Pirellulales bacterium]|nr:S41 family peptidase [Pirellulales bacterium]
MRAFSVRWFAFVWAMLALNAALGEEPNGGPRWPLVEGDLSEFARRVFQITDLVLDKHIEPPTRQEMLLCGLTAVHHNAVPDGLSRDVSQVASEDDFVQCLVRHWPDATQDADGVQRRPRFLFGLSCAVPGGLDFQSAKEAAVARQLAANQYVGIGIMLGRGNNANDYSIGGTFPRGPAAKAGIEEGELLVEVDGVKTKGLSMQDLIDRLRGPEGTTLTVGIARNADSAPRSVKLTRNVVPRQTVVGHYELAPEKWECIIVGQIPVAYLSVREINGSTVSELREYEAELASKNVSFLVLDLRRTQCSELRHALIFADALLDGGPVGIIRYRGARMSVPLDRDWLFRGWPMAVLVDDHTAGLTEWLAGLLQRHRGAVVVGRPTTGEWRFVLDALHHHRQAQPAPEAKDR